MAVKKIRNSVRFRSPLLSQNHPKIPPTASTAIILRNAAKHFYTRICFVKFSHRYACSCICTLCSKILKSFEANIYKSNTSIAIYLSVISTYANRFHSYKNQIKMNNWYHLFTDKFPAYQIIDRINNEWNE